MQLITPLTREDVYAVINDHSVRLSVPDHTVRQRTLRKARHDFPGKIELDDHIHIIGFLIKSVYKSHAGFYTLIYYNRSIFVYHASSKHGAWMPFSHFPGLLTELKTGVEVKHG